MEKEKRETEKEAEEMERLLKEKIRAWRIEARCHPDYQQDNQDK